MNMIYQARRHTDGDDRTEKSLTNHKLEPTKTLLIVEMQHVLFLRLFTS